MGRDVNTNLESYDPGPSRGMRRHSSTSALSSMHRPPPPPQAQVSEQVCGNSRPSSPSRGSCTPLPPHPDVKLLQQMPTAACMPPVTSQLGSHSHTQSFSRWQQSIGGGAPPNGVH